MKKLIIIDGSSILSTYFYATLPKGFLYLKTDEEKEARFGEIMQTSKGIYTNAIYGTLKLLKKIKKYENPDYLIVAFDKSRNTFRRKLYEPYKAQRKDTLVPLKDQFILMEKILEEMGICTLYGDEYEADDYIASAANKFSKEDVNVYVLSKDRDFLQLPSKNVKCWIIQNSEEAAFELCVKYNKQESNIFSKVFEYGEEEVFGEEGVYPSQFAELKALVGDSSDNYPGVKGIRSAAVPLLQRYGSIENLYNVIDEAVADENIDELATIWKERLGINKSTIKKLTATSDEVLTGKAAAFFFLTLAKMKDDINLNLRLEDTHFSWDQKKINDICNRLEINSL